MGYKHNQRYTPPDCPECGKKEGAFMSASEFGHDVSCCSQECGLAIAKKIERNRESSEYKNAVEEYHAAKDKMLGAKYKDVNAVGFADQTGQFPSFY